MGEFWILELLPKATKAGEHQKYSYLVIKSH